MSRRLVRQTASTTRHCDCAKVFDGFHPHPEHKDWWVRGCCDRPAKTYLDAREEQGDEWPPVVRVQAPTRRLVRRRPA